MGLYNPTNPNLNVTSVTGTYTATSSNDIILASGAAFTITLPAASSFTKVLRIKKTDDVFANIITITAAGSDTIEGSASTTLNTVDESIELYSDHSGTWYISSRRINGLWMANSGFTTQGFGTITNYDFVWKRVGGVMKVIGSFSSGTPSASMTASIILPAGLAIDFTQCAADDQIQIGLGYTLIPSDSIFPSQLQEALSISSSFTNQIFFAIAITSGGVFAPLLGSTFINSGNNQSVNFEIPILGWSG